MLTKVLVYGYCVGVFSSRRIQRRLVEDVAFRARFQAARLLTNANVQAALEAAESERRERTGVTPERVLRDIDRLANLDVGLLNDEQGRLKPIHTLPLEVRRAIESVEVVKRNLTAGDAVQEYVHKVKLVSKAKMQALFAKHTGLIDGEPLVKAPAVPAFVIHCFPSVQWQLASVPVHRGRHVAQKTARIWAECGLTARKSRAETRRRA